MEIGGYGTIVVLILGILKIFKNHLLVLVINWCTRIQKVKIITKTGGVEISKENEKCENWSMIKDCPSN